MGYFSNGTEGISYQEHYCYNCVNFRNKEGIPDSEGCAIWDLHWRWVGEKENKEVKQEALDHFIPQGPVKCKGWNGNDIEIQDNLECVMFIRKEQ